MPPVGLLVGAAAPISAQAVAAEQARVERAAELVAPAGRGLEELSDRRRVELELVDLRRHGVHVGADEGRGGVDAGGGRGLGLFEHV